MSVSNAGQQKNEGYQEKMLPKLFVVKRNGEREDVSFDKIKTRIERLSDGLNKKYIDIPRVCIRVIDGLKPGIETSQLDILAAETCAMLNTTHPDYATLAARIEVSNLHRQTMERFSDVMEELYHYHEPRSNEHLPLVSPQLIETVRKNKETLDAAIVYSRDYDYSYFGFKTLQKSYLLKIDGRVVERPQHLLMRVAVGIHGGDVAAALETYEAMSLRYFTHASPTLFNAGTMRPGLISCFLNTIDAENDSIEGIFDMVKECGCISKYSGGIGLSIHDVRANGSLIRSTNGRSEGIVPMLRVFNDTARYVTQNSKRAGSIAVYLEPWHAEIFEFLEMKRNTGKDEIRARDLFYALWVPDLFMQRVKDDGPWSLFCPREAPGLSSLHSDRFVDLYLHYENEKMYRRQVPARDLWLSIIESQMETGGPYLLYKDIINRKNPMSHLGMLRGSNLCAEIVQYNDKNETAACNLCSIGLPAFVRSREDKTYTFDHDELYRVTRIATRNLDKVIDVTHYPVAKAKVSNLRHRPMGIGVCGLADVFSRMRLPFDSPQARQLSKEISETIYFAACEMSAELAALHGSFPSFPGSEWSKGNFQFDLWEREGSGKILHSGRWDWEKLREKVKKGMRNSLLTAAMPTASTSQILGYNECFEPYNSNMYSRKVLAGEYQVVTRGLLKELCDRELWSDALKQKIISHEGNLRRIPEIPDDLKNLFKTSWELSNKIIIDMAADRAPYIDQTQSMNLFMAEPAFDKISSMHWHAYKQGLKTGMYYLRTKSSATTLKFTLNNTNTHAPVTNEPSGYCSLADKNDKECLSCQA